MARAGHTFSFVCDETHLPRILRVIVYCDGMITERTDQEDGVYVTVRKS